MASQNQLEFAIKATNEAAAAMSAVRQDLSLMEDAAAGNVPALRDLSAALGGLQGEVTKFSEEMEEAGGGFRVTRDGMLEVADAAGNLERIFIGVGDNLGVLEERFGVNLGPMRDYTQAAADVAGGMEGIIGGGTQLVGQLKNVVPGMVPVIASTYAYVSALVAQAAAMIAANWPILAIIAALALLAAGVFLVVKHWDTIVEKVPLLKPALEGAKQVFDDFMAFIEDPVIPILKSIWEKGLQPVINFLRDNWPIVASLIFLPFAPLILLATDAFGIRSALIGAIQAIVDKMEDAAGWIGHWLDVAGQSFEGFKNMAMGPINAVKQAVQDLIDLVQKIPTPGDIGGGLKNIGGKIPGLAEGGIVTGPTLALIGEAGPEAVVPLGGTGFGKMPSLGETHIHINAPVYGVDNLLQVIDLALKRANRPGLA